jgi:hypothetical protein
MIKKQRRFRFRVVFMRTKSVCRSPVTRSGYREFGRALRGRRICGFIPSKRSGKRSVRANVVAGCCDGRILAEFCDKGSATSKVFDDWFCGRLLPETHPGDFIISDNASFHNKKRLEEYALIYKVTVIFLSAYSPDYNPVEYIWANLKRFLRNYGQRFDSIASDIY